MKTHSFRSKDETKSSSTIKGFPCRPLLEGETADVLHLRVLACLQLTARLLVYLRRRPYLLSSKLLQKKSKKALDRSSVKTFIDLI